MADQEVLNELLREFNRRLSILEDRMADQEDRSNQLECSCEHCRKWFLAHMKGE